MPLPLFVATVLLLLLAPVSSSHADYFPGADIGASGDGRSMSFEFDADGQPAAAFFNYSNQNVYYFSFDGDEWKRELVAEDLSSQGETAVVPDSPDAEFFFSDPARSKIFVARKNAAQWQLSEVTPSIDAPGRMNASLCGSNICLSVYNESNKRLYLFKKNGSSWSRKLVENGSQATAGMHALAAMPDGRAVLSYFSGHSNKLVFALENGGSWTQEEVGLPERKVGINPAIVVDSASRIHISFSAFRSSATLSEKELYYTKREANGSWSRAVVSDDFAGGRSSISLSNSGLPQIAFRHFRNHGALGAYSGFGLAELDSSGRWKINTLSP